jgi:hypothetical protein
VNGPRWANDGLVLRIISILRSFLCTRVLCLANLGAGVLGLDQHCWDSGRGGTVTSQVFRLSSDQYFFPMSVSLF